MLQFAYVEIWMLFASKHYQSRHDAFPKIICVITLKVDPTSLKTTRLFAFDPIFNLPALVHFF
ncbi:MAG: hypothetical protein ABSC63_01095 [Candidatus Binataceae bacterium]